MGQADAEHVARQALQAGAAARLRGNVDLQEGVAGQAGALGQGWSVQTSLASAAAWLGCCRRDQLAVTAVTKRPAGATHQQRPEAAIGEGGLPHQRLRQLKCGGFVGGLAISEQHKRVLLLLAPSHPPCRGSAAGAPATCRGAALSSHGRRAITAAAGAAAMAAGSSHQRCPGGQVSDDLAGGGAQVGAVALQPTVAHRPRQLSQEGCLVE